MTNKKLEITDDKLVDILLHSATREDIAAAKAEILSEVRTPKTPQWMGAALTALIMLSGWVVYQTHMNQVGIAEVNKEISEARKDIGSTKTSIETLLEKQ